MSKSAIVVRDERECHRLVIIHRDWGLLRGPQFKEGPPFIDAFGIYDNYSVAGGIPDDSRVIRRGRVLYRAAQSLLGAVERDYDLLRYDYSYRYSQERSRHGGGTTIQYRGLHGILSTQPKGYCSVELYDGAAEGPPRIAEFIDLRVVGSIQTDTGAVIKVHRRKVEMHWPETLPPLLEFLRTRLDKDLVVEHHDRIDSDTGA